MRAMESDACGFVDRDGIRVFWERFGHGSPAILFLCATPIVDSRMWKAQVPWFARTHTVVTFDPRGNGRSDRPLDRSAYAAPEFVGDAIALLDAAGVDRAVAVGLCASGGVAMLLAADHAARVTGVVAINPGLAVTPPHAHRVHDDFDDEPTSDEGWAKENRHSWLRDWRGFSEFFFTEMVPEPHSSKLREDCVAWAQGTTPETILTEYVAPRALLPPVAAEVCRRVRCPVLVINGDQDQCQPPERSRRVAELTGGDLLVLEGAGHLPSARDPVRVNLATSEFLERITGNG